MAILCTGTVIRDEVGLSLEKADNEVLGTAAKIVVTKDSTTIVGDGTTQEEVNKRVMQIKNQIEVCILEDFKFCVPLLFIKSSSLSLSLWFCSVFQVAVGSPNSARQNCIHFCCIFVAVTSLGDIAQVFENIHFQATDQEYEREKLNERIAKLSGGVAVIQVILMLSFR